MTHRRNSPSSRELPNEPTTFRRKTPGSSNSAGDGMQMAVSLRDVAIEAGVSPATVSRVMRGHPQVSEETRGKVEQAIKRLGYTGRPASRLRAARGARRAIALMIPDVTSPFFAEVIAGVESQVYAHGFDFVLCTTDKRPQDEITARMNALHPAGLVVVTPHIGEDERLRRYELSLPVVVVDYHNEGSVSPHVSVDNLRAAYFATRYLIDKGHRDIAIITGPLYVQSASERLKGFRLAMDEAGLALRKDLVREGDFTVAGGARLAQDLMSCVEPRPTALFCSNDLMAVGALNALRERGIAVPGDVSVLGFDDLPIAQLVTPPLTTVAQPIREMGDVAARMLVRLIRGEQLETTRVIMEAKLVQRESA